MFKVAKFKVAKFKVKQLANLKKTVATGALKSFKVNKKLKIVHIVYTLATKVYFSLTDKEKTHDVLEGI